MALYKSVNGISIKLSDEEETALIAERAENIKLHNETKWVLERQREYPSIAELTVALYDTDDKADIEAKRAAVKLKYPKP